MTRVRLPVVLVLVGYAFPVAAEAQEHARLAAYLQSPAYEAMIAREAALMSQAAASAPAAPPARDPRRWVSRHPVLAGVLIGLGVGIPLDVASCLENEYGPLCGVGWASGIGLGAWGGAIAKARPKPRVTFSPTPVDAAEVERVVRALGVMERVRVATATEQLEGTIQTIGPDRFVLVPTTPRAPVEIQFSEVRGLQKRVSGATWTGVIVGGAVIGISTLAGIACAQTCN